MQTKYISTKQWFFTDLTIALLFVSIPLLIQLPYRVNIFLSWEGAYRLYLGQIPYKDFGLPLGFGYWIVPALFFKMFAPSFSALVMAQVFINCVSIFCLRGIFYNLNVRPVVISFALLVFCLSYVIYNFWPWYNHSVIVYELCALYFLTKYFKDVDSKFKLISLGLSALFSFLSFFTKQDAGAVCLCICISLLMYQWLAMGDKLPFFQFGIFYLIVASIFIVPFIRYDFFHFFNYGQPPHNSRLTLTDFLRVFFMDGYAEKIYLVMFVICVWVGRDVKDIFATREHAMLTMICVFMILQAMVTRVSSPLPTDHMTYFHTFGFVLLIRYFELDDFVKSPKGYSTTALLILIAFSAGYWGYASSLLGLSKAKKTETSQTMHSPWVKASVTGFDKVLIPHQTKEGIIRLMQSKDLRKITSLNVLNMSELTPLALTLDYTPPVNQPLWYHLNIGMFQKEVDMFCARVKSQEYDLILFEDIPDLTEFYPYQVRDTLRKYYHLEDQFLAPRKLENATIEVYVKDSVHTR